MKVLVLGLNEFNIDLLERSAREMQLKNIMKVISLSKVKTFTEDTYDSNFLEPWCQWVSVQTGAPAKVHKIKHLGDSPLLGQKQIWEVLSEQGVTSGVWGAMNATRNGAKNCKFFLPDPWTFSEDGYPGSVSDLLKMPRYVSKNYLNLSALKVLSLLPKFFKSFFETGLMLEVLRVLPEFLLNLIKFKFAHFVFIGYLDVLSTKLFLRFRKKYNPDFSFIFLNSVAHLQHHYWTDFDYKNNAKLNLGLHLVDRAVGDLLDSLDKSESFVMLNALSQENTNTDIPWILYRPKDHASLLRAIGIRPAKIEPHMTHDAHLFFHSLSERDQAVDILRSANISGQNFYLVETYKDEPLKLFYRIDFTGKVSADAVISLRAGKILMSEYFTAIVQRTGKHIQEGTIYQQGLQMPERIMNHELAAYIYGKFGASFARQ